MPPKKRFGFEHTQYLNNPELKHLTTDSSQFEPPYLKLAIACLLWILLYRLFPYDVTTARDFSPRFIISQFSEDGLSSLKDYIELLISLLVFALFSFGLTGTLRQRRLATTATVVSVALISISLSVMTEVAQAFLPSRNPNLPDILSDIVGMLVGWVSYYQFRFQLFYFAARRWRSFKQFLSKHLTLPSLGTVFVGYWVIASLGIAFIPFPTDFSNWNPNFSLNIGNEGSGNRPWQGAISQIQLFDQAASAADVAQLLSNQSPQSLNAGARLAAYTFTQKQQAYLDQTGRSPKLAWQGAPVSPANSGVPLGSGNWLRTHSPVSALNQQLRSTSELTLDVTLASADLNQKGPARIVSVSENSLHRNFTLGQDGQNLIFRLRTPMTGENGSNPQMVVPNIFTDNSSHHVVITYHHAVLQIYIDTLQNLHRFQLPYIGYKLLYYGLAFIPLGSLLGVLLALTQEYLAQLGILFSGLMIPPLLLEGLLVSLTPRSPASENLAFSLAFMAVGLWLIRRSFYHSLRRDFKLNHRKVSSY